jgi:hypothetical protein
MHPTTRKFLNKPLKFLYIIPETLNFTPDGVRALKV